MQCDTSPSHRADQAVDCGLWIVVPLLFNGCAKLLDIGRNWNTRRSRASQTCSMGDMSGEYADHGRTWTFSASGNCVQILMDMGPMHYHTETCDGSGWMACNGPQDCHVICAFTSPSIMSMVFVAYACPYHNPYRHHWALSKLGTNRSPTWRHTRGLQLWPGGSTAKFP